MKKEEERYLKSLGIRIVELRKIKGISQNELARRLGSKNTHVRRIERGETNCRIITLRKVAKALEVELGELVS